LTESDFSFTDSSTVATQQEADSLSGINSSGVLSASEALANNNTTYSAAADMNPSSVNSNFLLDGNASLDGFSTIKGSTDEAGDGFSLHDNSVNSAEIPESSTPKSATPKLSQKKKTSSKDKDGATLGAKAAKLGLYA
jgi:hypothetical protein